MKQGQPWKWVCEFCFRTTNEEVLPPDWELAYHSAVCPECKELVKKSGGYRVVCGGAFAMGRKDPRSK